MNTIQQTSETEGRKIPIKMEFSALWTALMFLYIYADIFSLFKPGQIDEMASGRMGPLVVTQGSMLGASILMLLPAVMVYLSLELRPKACRWANIVLGLLYTLVNIGNLSGESWAFYFVYGIVEVGLTLLIVGQAWRWRNFGE